MQNLGFKEIASQSKGPAVTERPEDRKGLTPNQKPFYKLENALASNHA